jgi:uncharacterized protein
MKRKILKLALGVVAIGMVGSWVAGSILMAPAKCKIAKPPDLVAEDVELATSAGDSIQGWWMPGSAEAPAVILVHGVRANRLAMLGRATLLSQHGYSVFLFDLPAHGESSGSFISFGKRESSAVSAVLAWVKSRKKDGRVGVDGVSLGGASVLLRAEHSGFDAIVVEAAFPDIHRAILHRLKDRFGIIGYGLEPLLRVQLIARLSEWPSELAPINEIAKVSAPILVVGGENDRLTPIEETREMYQKALEPKTLWIVPGAGHVDYLKTHPADFERIVGGFFDKYLKK